MEEEAGEREEEVDAEVAASHQPAGHPAGDDRAREEGGVREDDEPRRHGSQAVERRESGHERQL